MARPNKRYWLDTYGSQLADEHQAHIKLLIADFIRTVIDRRQFPHAEQMAKDVILGMVEAQESMIEFHFDNWR